MGGTTGILKHQGTGHVSSTGANFLWWTQECICFHSMMGSFLYHRYKEDILPAVRKHEPSATLLTTVAEGAEWKLGHQSSDHHIPPERMLFLKIA